MEGRRNKKQDERKEKKEGIQNKKVLRSKEIRKD
jgi:hypothetical protein